MIKQNITLLYPNSKVEVIINESDMYVESIYTKTISNIQKSLGKGSGCFINSVIKHNINISKYNPLAGSSCIKLPKKLNHSSND